MMKIFAYLLPIVIFSFTRCEAQREISFDKGIFTSENDSLPYRILYPQDYDSNTRYPMLVFLHGSGARGNDNEAQLSNVPQAFLNEYNRTTFPCFILAPQCAQNDAWVNFPDFPHSLQATDTPTTSASMTLELITTLVKTLNIDTQRIYLTGYSMGGEGTFDFIARKPELFAAAAPVCPVADTANAHLIKDNDIWIFHGAEDKVNAVQYSRIAVDALRRQGADPLYTEYPGTGHRCWPLAYNEPDLLPWMFSHVKTNNLSSAKGEVLTRMDTLMGTVTPEREWWDVQRYDLRIEPHFETRTITGSNSITYNVIGTGSSIMQIDLQQPLKIDSVLLDGTTRISFSADRHVWYLQMPPQAIGTQHTAAVYYSGIPHVAKSPPWHGGFTWTRDSLHRPWIATSCQLTGASVWYPCKSHQGDEPDSGASVTIIMPDTLVAVANGRLAAKQPYGQNRTAYTWSVVNPINNYGLCFYAGKYVHIREPYTGTAGNLPLNFWMLDYNVERAKHHLLPGTKLAIDAMEHWLGPYPFYEDEVKLVDAPYIGMEHQSAVAYGNRYNNGYKGRDISGTGWGMKYDIILVHELAHEWFGNSITTKDLADKWIHEGLAGYTEILYLEQQFGKDAAREYLIAKRKSILNSRPVIARYNINESGDSDDYAKGRAVIHMVRAIMNDDAKFRQLLIDINKKFYHTTTTSQAIEQYISQASGTDFSKMFAQYLHTTKLPVLEYKISGSKLQYRYANCREDFTMPLKTIINGEQWLKPTTTWKHVRLKKGKVATLEIDPDFYVTAKKVL